MIRMLKNRRTRNGVGFYIYPPSSPYNGGLMVGLLRNEAAVFPQCGNFGASPKTVSFYDDRQQDLIQIWSGFWVLRAKGAIFRKIPVSTMGGAPEDRRQRRRPG